VAIQADSASPQAIRAAVASSVEQLGGLDILVNNAGIARVVRWKRCPMKTLMR
jgi:NAD(P)-dependent dehydrogenase (short-subunit alcohol dehydrogenase family)